MSTGFSLKVDLLAGTDIKAAVIDARVLAAKLDLAYVTFKFNGIDFSISQFANVERAVQIYNQAVSSASDIRMVIL